jgi:hypothetical protein
MEKRIIDNNYLVFSLILILVVIVGLIVYLFFTDTNRIYECNVICEGVSVPTDCNWLIDHKENLSDKLGRFL